MIKLKDLLIEVGKDGTVWIGNETYQKILKPFELMRRQYIPLTPKVVESIVGRRYLSRVFI